MGHHKLKTVQKHLCWHSNGPRYWGLGVRLGNSEGWKAQKVGGCGWSRCPRNRILSHVAKDMPILGLWVSAFGASWGLFGPSPGHIMELEGRKDLHDTGKSSRTWSAPTVSFGLAVLNVFQGFFGPKMAALGPKTAVFETEVRHLRIPFTAATVEFLAQTLCDCTSHP